MICVCNTSPLIALAKIDLLDIIPSLNFEMFYIPPSVQQELVAKAGPESAALSSAIERFIHVRAPGQVPADVEQATTNIDPGERDVIRLVQPGGNNIPIRGPFSASHEIRAPLSNW